MPLYLLDANVLITAHETYYPIEAVPQFWEWLLRMAQDGQIKMPYPIHEEIAVATGPLADWVKDTDIANALVLDEEPARALIQRVLSQGYAPDLNDQDIEKVGRDPFLVAAGLNGQDRCVVTKEVSKPSRTRANRKIPDVCNSVGAVWSPDFPIFKQLGFTTK